MWYAGEKERENERKKVENTWQTTSTAKALKQSVSHFMDERGELHDNREKMNEKREEKRQANNMSEHYKRYIDVCYCKKKKRKLNMRIGPWERNGSIFWRFIEASCMLCVWELLKIIRHMFALIFCVCSWATFWKWITIWWL